MSKLLSEARTLVAKYLDDVDNVVASTANIDDALNVAQHAVYLQASQWAPQKFAVEASVTTASTGAADLSSIDPVRIIAVNEYSGGARFPIAPASLADGPTNCLGVRTLKLLYIPALTFPSGASVAFTWGQSGLDLPLLDDLMCVHAASHLTAFLDDSKKQLEQRLKVLEEKAQNIMNFAAWRVTPLRSTSRNSGLAWVMTDGVTLQIVRV